MMNSTTTLNNNHLRHPTHQVPYLDPLMEQHKEEFDDAANVGYRPEVPYPMDECAEEIGFSQSQHQYYSQTSDHQQH